MRMLLVCVAVMVSAVALCGGGCVSSQVRDRVVVPELAVDAPFVRVYAEWGAARVPADDRDAAADDVAKFFGACGSGDAAVVIRDAVPLRARVMALARAGIQAKVDSGEWAEVNARHRFNEIREFDAMVAGLAR